MELAKELAVLDPMMGVLLKLLYALSGDIASVLHTNLEILSVALDLIIMEELVLQVEQEEQQLEVLKQMLVVEKQEEQKLKKQGHLQMKEQVEKQKLGRQGHLEMEGQVEKQEELKQLEKKQKMLELEIKFVEQDKEPAVLDPMMGVHQRLLYVQSGDIASVPHTNLEILNVDLVLIIMEVEVEKQQLVLEDQKQQKWKQLEMEEEQQEEVKQREVEEQLEMETLLEGEELQEMGIKFVELAKELAVLDPMMGVHQRLLYALNGVIASVLHISLEIQSVDLALMAQEKMETKSMVQLMMMIQAVETTKVVVKLGVEQKMKQEKEGVKQGMKEMK